MVLVTDRQFRFFLASIGIGIVLAFWVPLAIYSRADTPTVEIRPDPATGAAREPGRRRRPDSTTDAVREPGRRREPVLRASRRPMSYSPLEDM